MARLLRLNIAGVPQHAIQRGNNRQATFFHDDDYSVYLDKLKDYGEKYDVAIHAYVLMTNHVHLLMTPARETGISKLMQSLGRYYVRYINQTYRRSGTLWEGRYRSTLVDKEDYFLTVSRYIELNPVRANMVQDPKDYPWSSYHHNALDAEIELITGHPCYDALGHTGGQRRKAYQGLFKEGIPDPALEEIRLNTNKAWVLGGDRFKGEIKKMTDRRIEPIPRGGDRRSKKYREAANA
ncbi:transposase [Magnetospira sp. QH-2]|uniref:transposase n=1 Tax=Magnetospira sp. (strain QH-2) TaxID=1288970 RepID=UPI0005F9C241|nr:transposase [Magnetospira sp. QH-2]